MFGSWQDPFTGANRGPRRNVPCGLGLAAGGKAQRAPRLLPAQRQQAHASFDLCLIAPAVCGFQRLHGSEQGAGDGIGLTIAQQIAARHRGRIHADAVPGSGANFHVELLDLPLPGDDTPGHERQEARAA